jgi:ubiquitin-activating enzyme E1
LVFAAKNLILSGVRSLTLHDPKKVQLRDLSAQFYLGEADVGKNRAEACANRLQELNPAVLVATSAAKLDTAFLKQFQVLYTLHTY